jgi:hypothetical protein
MQAGKKYTIVAGAVQSGDSLGSKVFVALVVTAPGTSPYGRP